MNTAQKTERTLIHVALLFAPYVPEPDVLTHYVGRLSDEDRAELKDFMTTVTLPLLRFMRPEEAKTLYAASTPELVEVANAFNEAFDGVYMIRASDVMARPAPDPKQLLKVLEAAVTALDAAEAAPVARSA